MNLSKQRGSTQVLGLVLTTLLIGIIGMAAVRVGGSDARHRDYYRSRTLNSVRQNTSSYQNTGSRATCTVNGRQVPTVNGRCSASSPGTPGVSNSTTNIYTSQGSSGSPGISRCTVTNSDGTTTTKTDGTPCVAY